MPNEIWKLWKEGYTVNLKTRTVFIPPIYVSNLGNVRGRKIIPDNRGYLTISYKNKKYKLHRIIAEVFIPNPENKSQIDHINTDKLDNRVENLRWCTPKENSNNPITIYHLKICQLPTKYNILCVETGKKYISTRDAARDVKGSDGSIRMAIRNGYKAAGYSWRRLTPEEIEQEEK